MYANWGEYWSSATFELNTRTNTIKELLKLELAQEVTYGRIGSPHDGGYIMAIDFKPDDYLVSLGIDTNVEFEQQLSLQVKGMDTYDYSIESLPSPVLNSRFFKEKIGEVTIAQTIDRAKEIAPNSDLLLKMDIEGSEWGVLGNQDLSAFRQIVLEGHWLFNLVDESFYEQIKASLTSLRQTHTPVFVHANNDQPIVSLGANPIPNVIEVLYLRNDSYTFKPYDDPFKGLITKNNLNFPEIGLTFP